MIINYLILGIKIMNIDVNRMCDCNFETLRKNDG